MRILKKMWNHIKKYWVCYTCSFFIILLPFIIGALTACNKFVPWEIAGEPKDWLTFWGSYISGIASFIMIWVAWKTLIESKEINRPFIYVRVTKRLSKIYLVLENVGKLPALNLTVSFNQLNENTKLFSQDIDKMNMVIPADRNQKIFLCFDKLTRANATFITDADAKNETIKFRGKKYSFEQYNNLYDQLINEVNTIIIKYNQYDEMVPINLQCPEEEQQDLLLVIARELERIGESLKSKKNLDDKN